MISVTRRMKACCRALWLGLALAATSLPAAAQDLGVIPARVIYPGETIAGEDLKMARVRKGSRATIAFARQPDQLVGKVARRTLLPGRFVPLTSVREAYLVQRGAPVHVILVDGGLTISVGAISLEPGAAGDVVKVRNTDSGAVFPATVMADGTVRVGDT